MIIIFNNYFDNKVFMNNFDDEFEIILVQEIAVIVNMILPLKAVDFFIYFLKLNSNILTNDTI